MAKYSRLLSLSILLALYNPAQLSAQAWLWGLSGGSTHDQAGSTSDEKVYDMATDPNGNVYAVSTIAASPSAHLGQTSLNTYGSPTTHPVNLLISSYSCDGTLRWKKVIGGDASCTVQSVRTDNAGHVYVMGTVFAVPYTLGNPPVRVHFDADTTLPYDLYKTIFIAQYDTSGNYQWLRMPESDTATISSISRATSYDMAVDNSGNLNVLTFLTAGSLTGTNYTVANNGLYILKYDQQGTLLSAAPPAGFNFATIGSGPLTGYPNAAFESFRMAQAPGGHWVIAGSQSPYVGVLGFTVNGQLIEHPAFVASFDNQWQYLWHAVADDDLSRIWGRPETDAGNHIFLTGAAYDDQPLLGDTIHVNTPGAVPFVAKLNADGSTQWLSHASSNDVISGNCTAVSMGQALARSSGGDIVVTGGCAGLIWDNVQVPGICNADYNTFVARLDGASGSVSGIDTIPKSGSGNFVPGGNFGTSIAAGSNNNIFVGGKMTYGQITGTDTLQFIGGDMDFFISKYGYACNCIMPLAAFTQSGSNTTISLTYTGTTTDVDSVVWDLGDGQYLSLTGTAISNTFNHTYANTGSYPVCVTAYNAECGHNQVCHDIQAGTTSIVGTGLPGNVQVYPNPAVDYLMVAAAKDARIRIFNITGQCLLDQSIKTPLERIALGNITAGNYIVVLTTASGIQGRILITKH